MTTRLTWIASPSAACFDAVRRLAGGQTAVNSALADALGAPAANLRDFLLAAGAPLAEFFAELVPAAAVIESNRQLAHTALTKSLGRGRAEPLVERLAGLLTDCEQASAAAFPRLRDELELRFRPLRELWETRGPGMLAAVGRRTERTLIVDAASVVAVAPFLGGAGWAAPKSNTVVIEAVLANPLGELPETVRLGWLLAQLAADLPDFAELVGPGRSAELFAWAMLPPALEAAADLELVRPVDERLVRAAAESWLPAAIAAPEFVVDERSLAALEGWRQTAAASAAPWTVKLKALEQLLSEAIS